jgi:deoxyribodipyrimidine photo-lyase
MRSLKHSGWLNFRMRAMLVSFACYDLWLDWRPLAPVLARRFLDYEPGIHYPQLQMQAGTTGMNANRIYSATKQVPSLPPSCSSPHIAAAHRDHVTSRQAEDHAGPDFVFIRRWVPELSRVPAQYMAQPHTMPPAVQRSSGCVIGADYPPPIVDRAASYSHARCSLPTQPQKCFLIIFNSSLGPNSRRSKVRRRQSKRRRRCSNSTAHASAPLQGLPRANRLR